jgi:hypothetical protein
MTVAELIDALSKFPPESKVWLEQDAGYSDDCGVEKLSDHGENIVALFPK